MSKIKIVALYGKAGAGKDAVLQAVIKNSWAKDIVNEIVSCTTRPPRQGEVNHINYHFISIEEFTQMVLNGDMLEATEFREWWYGTPLLSLNPDKVNIGVFNPAGLLAIMEDPRLDVIPIMIDASDKTRLLRQLNREDDPDVAEIIRRYQTDEKDFRAFDAEDLDWERHMFCIDNNQGDIRDKAGLVLSICSAFGQNRLNDLE